MRRNTESKTPQFHGLLRWIALILVAGYSILALSGCASTPKVCAQGQPYSSCNSNMKSLGEIVDGRKEIVVFLVHGVGDYCPEYALDPEKGWIRTKSLAALGLQPVTEKPEFRTHPVRLDGMADQPIAGQYTVGVGEFRYATTGTRVVAVEITWSQVTQWLKNSQLQFDEAERSDAPKHRGSTNSASATASAKRSFEPHRCPEPRQPNIVRQPPPRASINRLLKEQTIDRGMADAILYAGSYGRTMRYALSEALCHGLKQARAQLSNAHDPASDDEGPCEWPDRASIDATRKTTAYVFVTHSLGSLMLFNVLSAIDDAQDFPDIRRSEDAASGLVCLSPAFYMMANQVAFMGLSTDRIRQYVDAHGYDSSAMSATQAPRSSAALTLLNPGVAAVCDDGARPTMLLAAFSDTNDLLTWPFPPYVDVRNSEVHDVYVQNGTTWFGSVENPETAHANYFFNPDVWEVVLCGATHGVVSPQCWVP